MGIKSKKRNDNKKRIESLNLNFRYFKVYIQCPNCGEILKINADRNYYCKDCNHVYSENEIREKCGL